MFRKCPIDTQWLHCKGRLWSLDSDYLTRWDRIPVSWNSQAISLPPWMLTSICLVQDNSEKGSRGGPWKGKSRGSVVLLQTVVPVFRHQGQRERREKMFVYLCVIMHPLWTSDTLKDCLWTKDAQLFSELNTQHICFVNYKSVRPRS